MRKIRVAGGGAGDVYVEIVDDDTVLDELVYSSVDARWLGAQLLAASAEAETDNQSPSPHRSRRKHA